MSNTIPRLLNCSFRGWLRVNLYGILFDKCSCSICSTFSFWAATWMVGIYFGPHSLKKFRRLCKPIIADSFCDRHVPLIELYISHLLKKNSSAQISSILTQPARILHRGSIRWAFCTQKDKMYVHPIDPTFLQGKELPWALIKKLTV